MAALVHDRRPAGARLQVGYRWYDAQNLTPLFPFGYGLSYTTFAFSHLRVSGRMSANSSVTVKARVTNTGRRAGAEVAQLYLGMPASAGEPPRQLRGFQKVQLRPGQSKVVSFVLTPRDASYWNTADQRWTLAGGGYTVQVGDSSRSLPLSGTFQVGQTVELR